MNADVLTTKCRRNCGRYIGQPKRIYFDAEMGDVLTEALDQSLVTLRFALSSLLGRARLFQSSF